MKKINTLFVIILSGIVSTICLFIINYSIDRDLISSVLMWIVGVAVGFLIRGIIQKNN